jgi:hypothetical protein
LVVLPRSARTELPPPAPAAVAPPVTLETRPPPAVRSKATAHLDQTRSTTTRSTSEASRRSCLRYRHRAWSRCAVALERLLTGLEVNEIVVVVVKEASPRPTHPRTTAMSEAARSRLAGVPQAEDESRASRVVRQQQEQAVSTIAGRSGRLVLSRNRPPRYRPVRASLPSYSHSHGLRSERQL